MSNVYYEFTALLLISALVGAIAVRLRQPLIVAFIFVGILVGPAALGLVRSHDEIALLAQIGVTVLLFVVGLKLDLHLIRHIGPVALATGLGQIGFTIVFGYLIGLGFGMDHTKAIYIAIALAFSSTIIIVKLLSDKREIDSLHGRIAMGILIVQDIAVVIAMMTVGSLHGEMDTGIGFTFLTIIGRLAAAAIFVAVFMRLVFPYLLGSLARSQELLLLFGIAWGTALASAGELLGFSKEVGAFLAGFSLASTPYREAISARLTSLRDFLLLFFFIDLGSRIDLSTLGAEVYTAVVFSLFVLIGKPLIVMAIMAYLGYRKRTGFMTGLTLAQISEFSIIFMAMSISLGHIEQETLGLVTLVGLVTITLSTYMILYSQPLYEWLVPWLSVFERSDPFRERAVEKGRRTGEEAEFIIFGVGRYGGRLVLRLQERGLAVLGVDFDPENVRAMRRKGIPMRFGDAEDLDFPESLPLENVRWVISTLPHPDVNLTLMRALANQDYTGKVAVTAHNEPEGKMLEKAGAHHVLYPFMDAAEFAAEVIAGESKTQVD
ncbi:MAG: sodium:proton exchanger [Gammaproteobacteria bacterium RIFCSPLOWO2_12_FULL_47_76]|nr:MAG: sodium:proton exchanger [Gammaproteobacteria bacterium RIFCSPLOWO2_12_FULL_47_76]